MGPTNLTINSTASQPLQSNLSKKIYTNVLSCLVIHNHGIMVIIEILTMRICTYFQNKNLKFVTLADIIFGLPKCVSLEITRQFTERTGSFLGEPTYTIMSSCKVLKSLRSRYVFQYNIWRISKQIGGWDNFYDDTIIRHPVLALALSLYTSYY